MSDLESCKSAKWLASALTENWISIIKITMAAENIETAKPKKVKAQSIKPIYPKKIVNKLNKKLIEDNVCIARTICNLTVSTFNWSI